MITYPFEWLVKMWLASSWIMIMIIPKIWVCLQIGYPEI